VVARDARSFTGGYFSFRGCKLWYETSGELRGGAPIVMLHGGPGIPENSYAPLMQRLAPARPSDTTSSDADAQIDRSTRRSGRSRRFSTN